MLQRIADFTEHQEDLKAKVVGALAYPVFLAGAGFIVLNILILFFVPRFEPIFKKLEDKDALPAISMLLMSTSHFLMGWGGVGILAAVVVGGMVYWRWSGTPNGRLRVDGWRLRLPGAGATCGPATKTSLTLSKPGLAGRSCPLPISPKTTSEKWSCTSGACAPLRQTHPSKGTPNAERRSFGERGIAVAVIWS